MFWYALAVLAVAMAVMFSAARFLLPNAQEYTRDVERLLGTTLNAPVRIDELSASWHRFGPQLVVKNVRVLDALSQQELARFDQARLDFDLGAFIRHGTLGLNGVAFSGIRVVLERNAEGQVRVIGLGHVNTDAANFDPAAVEQWLFGGLRWDIENSQIEWRDVAYPESPLLFTDVFLHLRNDGARHELAGRVQLPPHLGNELKFGIDISGRPLQPELWHGRVYVAANNLHLPGFVARLPEQARMPLLTGNANVTLWSHWAGGVQRVTGEVAVNQLEMAPVTADVPGAKFDELKTQFSAARTEHGWATRLQRLTMTRDDRVWPETQARLKVGFRPGAKLPEVDAEFSFARVEDLVMLALQWNRLDPAARDHLARAQPRGDARDFRFTLHNDTQYTLRAQVSGMGVTAHDRFPGFTGVNGEIHADQFGGTIGLNSHASLLYMPNLFRGPLPLGGVHGKVGWSIEPETGAWRVASDALEINGADAEITASLDLDAPDAHTPPRIDLVAAFRNGDGRQLSRYLPVSIMPVSVVDWLDRSIKDAHITEGGVVIHGRVDQFPFRDGNGRFEVRAQIENGSLDYVHDWPTVEQINAELVFSQRSMEVLGRSARILNSDVRDVYVTIPDLGSPWSMLTVSGDVAGDASDPLQFIQLVPPLRERVGRNLGDVAVRGGSDLHLELAIPLGRELNTDVKTNAFVRMKDAELDLGGWKQLLGKVNGNLHIDNDGVRGSRIKAHVLDQPATLEIVTANASDGAQVQVRSRGAFSPAGLLARFKPEWSDRFKGDGRWAASLKLPLTPGSNSAKKLRVDALLDDVAVTLPEPLAKSAGQALFLEVTSEFTETEQKLFVQYGNRIGTAMQLVREDDETRLARGEVRFGEGRATIPRQPGLRISGNTEKLSLDEWRNEPGAAVMWNADVAPTPSARTRPPVLYDVDLHAKQLIAFTQPLRDARVKIVRGGKEWRATIASEEFTGKVTIPIELKQAPIVMDLERWKYIPGDGTSRTSLDPRELPALEIRSDKFSYGNVDLGRLVLKSSKFTYGWRVDALELIAPLSMINGSGAWSYDGKTHQSHFNLDVLSENIGSTMNTFGYAGSIAEGKGRINAQVSWAAPMPDVAPGLLDGRVTLDFRKGRLLEVSPGAGRLFALLSVQALPRRLSLDFTDLFAKGFAFDTINGEFRLEDGEAYTSTLAMDGPAARVRAYGRVGLHNRDYDQLVRVIPDLTSSVPTLTAIATVSPQIGVVTYVLGKIFQSQIDDAAAVDYTITGSWDNPQIERIITAAKPGPVNEDSP